MHQSRKNAVLSQGLNLTLVIWGEVYVSLHSKASPCKLRAKIPHRSNGTERPKYMNYAPYLFMTWKLSIFPFPPSERLWPYNFNHPSTHQESIVFWKNLEKKSKSILFFTVPKWVVPCHGNEVRMADSCSVFLLAGRWRSKTPSSCLADPSQMGCKQDRSAALTALEKKRGIYNSL